MDKAGYSKSLVHSFQSTWGHTPQDRTISSA